MSKTIKTRTGNDVEELAGKHDAGMTEAALPLPFPPREFCARLLAWFAAVMRPLPWRETYDPYSVWISEIMLQQTQMERGVKYFNAWMNRFPDVRSVAEADEEMVLAVWEGLGYYSRARNIHVAAKRIMEKYGGNFPQDIETIRTLPGVGEYTAGAIASIAFNAPEPAVDANVLRIFARLADLAAPVTGKMARAAIAGTVRLLLSHASSRLINQALMEFGALVCTKVPKCGDCPFADSCAARRRGTIADRPRKNGRPVYRELTMVAAIMICGKSVFIRKRPPGGLWGGLWEFPGRSLEEGEPPEKALVRYLEEKMVRAPRVREKLAVVRHSYTTYRVAMHGYVCRMGEKRDVGTELAGKWIDREDVASYAFPAGHRKLLEHLGWK